MPDWSYRTVLRPLAMPLGSARAHHLAVGTLRLLSRSPLGLHFIDFLGHMRADSRLQVGVGEAVFGSPVVLGSRVDPTAHALPSLARFGAGMIEVGPVTPENAGVIERNLSRANGCIPVCIRIGRGDAAAVQAIEAQLSPFATFWVVDPANAGHLSGSRRVLSDGTAHPSAAGVWLRGDVQQVRTMRTSLGPDAILVAAGASEPDDVRALLGAGASLVVIEEGLATSGPGLVKRCNEALLSERVPPIEPEPLTLDAARRSWFWGFLLGASMIAGGLMALIIASTRVVLPYDEALCGLTRAQMAALNPRLLPFMAHDRVSLAGAMLSIGIFYAALGWNGIRRGKHWAHVTLVVSALLGFASFFSFLGFGYFDPFHAFVTAILTQLTLLCLVLAPSPAQPPRGEWRETAAWRRGQYGQLLFVILGIGLTGAGIVMTVIGCTRVFVESDLEFMRTTAAQLALSYDRLVPLVAHDRASLGGMLVSNGVVVWLSAQWGFRAGERWLWRALAWGGNIAFACAVIVHVIVGYDELLHLAPAILGWMLWNVALALTREWLLVD